MPVVGGLDIHRKQITFDYLDTVTGQVHRGQITPADRVHLRAWLARFAGREDAAFAVEGCAGWRYVAEELAAAGVTAHLAEPANRVRPRPQAARQDRQDRRRHLRMLLAEGRLAAVLDPARPHPGGPGAARAVQRSAPRAHRLGAADPATPEPGQPRPRMPHIEPLRSPEDAGKAARRAFSPSPSVTQRDVISLTRPVTRTSSRC